MVPLNEERNCRQYLIKYLASCFDANWLVQIDWPEAGKDGMRQTKAIYKFEYLPTGLFNRAQVSVSKLVVLASLYILRIFIELTLRRGESVIS